MPFRIHGSTYLVVMLTVGVLVALIVPGQVTHALICFGDQFNSFEHGWPWRYLTRGLFTDPEGYLPVGTIPEGRRNTSVSF